MLQQSDVDALLAAFIATQESEQNRRQQQQRAVSELKIYDFAQPDNLPSEFMRALDNINATFARTIAGMLSGYLSLGVQFEPLSADQMTFRQFCNSVPELTAIGVYTLTPMEGTALLEINPHIAWHLLERGLGGKGDSIEEGHEYTPLEKGLLDELVFRRIIRELGKAWKLLVPMRPSLREVVTNPAITRIAQPDDRMVVCTFSIAIGSLTGMSSYCIPVSSLDFERLLTPDCSWDDLTATEEDEMIEQAQVAHNMLEVPLCVRACLPDISIPLGELALLREGDVLRLDAEAHDLVEVRISDFSLFTGQPVTVRDKVGVELTGKLV